MALAFLLVVECSWWSSADVGGGVPDVGMESDTGGYFTVSCGDMTDHWN
jgi:hypothetical protein